MLMPGPVSVVDNPVTAAEFLSRVTRTFRGWTRFSSRGSRLLEPLRDIRRLEAHGDDRERRRGAVGEPVAPNLEPEPPVLRKLRRWGRRGVAHRLAQIAQRLEAFFLQIVARTVVKLLLGVSGELDHPARIASQPRRCFAVMTGIARREDAGLLRSMRIWTPAPARE